MFGVADDSFDCTSGHPTHPDPNAKFGAGFTSMGWGLYNFNGASYHDTKGTGQQGHEAWKVVPNVATNGATNCANAQSPGLAEDAWQAALVSMSKNRVATFRISPSNPPAARKYPESGTATSRVDLGRRLAT